MKVKKFDILLVSIEVEYVRPVLGRLLGIFYWLMCIRMKKFNVTINREKICSFYRLIIPRFMKGGAPGEE